MQYNLKIKLLDNSTMPKKAHKWDACYDCYSAEEVVLEPNSINIVSLGFKVEIPTGTQLMLFSRSGLSVKGIRLSNQPGIIDCGYAGVVKAIVCNDTSTRFSVKVGDRIAQMQLMPVLDTTLTQITSLESTERGEGGFGSTGR